MLGLGLQRSSKVGKKYILDSLGVVDTCVLGFSLYQLTNRYKGNCIKVRRASDNDELDIGFKDGFIDIDLLELFCNGTDGYVKIWYNQGQSSGVQDAIQTTNGSQPQIVSSGSFFSDGLKFDAIDDYMSVIVYTAIDITTHPLSYYMNYCNNNYHNGFYFAKYFSGGSSFNIQYCLQSITTTARIFVNGSMGRVITTASHNGEGCDKILVSWGGTGTNEFKFKTGGDLSENTVNGTLSSYNTFTIGNWNSGNFIDANIKSLLIFNSDEYSNYSELANNC